MPYASKTKVPADRSRAQIDQLLRKNGATGFAYGEQEARAMIAFEIFGRRVRFLVPMPVAKKGAQIGSPNHENAVIRETARRWRALLLVIKAKLEAVSSKIVTFDEEFLAHIVVEGNYTVGDRIVPGLHAAIASGKGLPPLLGAGSE